MRHERPAVPIEQRFIAAHSRTFAAGEDETVHWYLLMTLT